MSNLMVLENKELTIKSVELVDIINQFREVEGNRAVLRHDNFKAKIEKEIETLKSFGITNVLNFKVVKYKDAKGELRDCFELNRDGMLQMLNSESALVRYKTIEYINKLEEDLTNKQMLIQSNKLALANKEIEELKTSLDNTLQDFKTSIEEAKKQFKPSHKRKLDYTKTIKALSEDEEEAQFIKDWVFTTMGYTKWEDACAGDHKRILDIIGTVSRMLAINKITLI